MNYEEHGARLGEEIARIGIRDHTEFSWKITDSGDVRCWAEHQWMNRQFDVYEATASFDETMKMLANEKTGQNYRGFNICISMGEIPTGRVTKRDRHEPRRPAGDPLSPAQLRDIQTEFDAMSGKGGSGRYTGGEELAKK